MQKKQMFAVLYGCATTFILLIICNTILSFAIQTQFVTHKNIFLVSFLIGLVILFISGMITGIKGKENGWLLGGLVGLIFILMIFFIQYVGLEEQILLKQSIYLITYMLSAMIGSVLGVNFTHKENN